MEQNVINVRLKNLRKNSKLTQSQMAEYLEIDQSMVTKLENGSRVLNVTIIERICNLFGCSEEYLLGQSDAYIPLTFAFRSNGIQSDDLQSIADVNKIAMNISYMNEMIGEN